MKESRGQLTRFKIAETALTLLDEVGLEGLSMRKLGARLGVEAMSLYNYVANKADLLDAVHELLLSRLLARLEARAEMAGWKEVGRQMTATFLQLLKAHPGTIPLFASRSAIAPGSLATLDGAIGLLVRVGFPPLDALYAFQTFFAFTLGHAIFHYGPRATNSYARMEDYAKYPHLALVGLPSSGQGQDPDAEFFFGIEVLLEGLECRLKLEE